MPQRHHGIDLGGAKCRHEARHEGDGEQNQACRQEGRRIVSAHREELAGKGSHEHSRPHRSDADSSQCRPQSLRKHKPPDLPTPSAERHANAYFMGTLRHVVAHYAVEAKRGKEQREHGENCQQGTDDPLVAEATPLGIAPWFRGWQPARRVHRCHCGPHRVAHLCRVRPGLDDEEGLRNRLLHKGVITNALAGIPHQG